MKVVILAGGFGTRISEESHLKPKPMIEIGGKPILWHIMKTYSSYGYNDFVICLGYKSYVIKEFFSNYFLHTSDVTFDMTNNQMTIHNNFSEPWKVTLVDTGLHTMTGGRIKRIKDYIDEDSFMMTYGDGVCDVDINKLVEFSKENDKIATMLAVQPSGRFGVLDIKDNLVHSFREKSKEDMGWINAGYMVLKKEIFDYIEDDSTVFEKTPLESLAAKEELIAYKHDGFWQCMDTQRDKFLLEDLWENGEAPWRKW